ncbi:bifunctional 4-hydroxy-2-oxoglutarate aldolase/2-dehydro-3-deoxy-phosphogluconate aldolase [Glycomyces harbinensis]|uniref:2-dehydro-3-deoxyphosphogluconate aldolase / (4S)-4-hydroxy-2-oxoglutarate aldolase n=1 Tax=Glycomyces harbinensis TaxID=58114 RepID=A0A1G6RM66_9ACTN|nr:bifunctional 4-hydroxy-2-oxoglutarate aldolase/2-dehydro-3-deoxy-phosphogluconate aldolase [Glycomyces harbinensis]SDD05444.1 2-dehydro-3-deoxyphosphogluconate aldolase / (4S)-4-hydroxy-2-oxoglutarate aldolase [Glycomyces harbinensis]
MTLHQGDYFDRLFDGHRVMAIWRGLPADDTVELSERLWDAGLDLVEVPIGQPGQEAALAAAVKAAEPRGHAVGAGTVVSLGHVERAAAAGAAYTIAPGLNPAVLEASHAAGMPHLPGVATASEVGLARDLGCRWMKVFPASALGPDWFKAMAGPFPDVRFVATGGIDPDAVDTYLKAGASVIGMGSALADPANIEKLLG